MSTLVLVPVLVFLLSSAGEPSRPLDDSPPPRNVAAQLLDEADRSYAAREWAEAARAYRRLLDENPHHGEFWYRLATARYHLKAYEASAKAYRQAVDLGHAVGTSLYNMGCDYALLGETEKAVAAIGESIRRGLRRREQLIRTDSDLDSIRETELYRQQILPRVAAETPRIEGWQTDLRYLVKRIKETHYDPFRYLSDEEWQRSLARLEGRLPELDDHEVIVEMMKLVARLRDGHSAVWRPRSGRYQFHMIPAEFYIFEDGVFVLSAASTYSRAVGGKVLRIGEMRVDDALRRVAAVTHRDNPMQLKWLTPRFLACVEVLHALGIVADLDRVEVTIEQGKRREETILFDPVSLAEERRIARGRYPGLVTMFNQENVPLWRKDPNNPYWFEFIEKSKVVYFQFNQVGNREGGESLADFTTRLFQVIETEDVEALVIDIRRNNGGNNFLNRPIIHAIIRNTKINKRGRLFAIIGRETFSAAQNFSNQLERETEILFVGEPTGSSPNFVGEGNPITLPYSGLTVNASSRYWQDSLSDDDRIWIPPDLAAAFASRDVLSGRDPALEAIFSYLTSRKLGGGQKSLRRSED